MHIRRSHFIIATFSTLFFFLVYFLLNHYLDASCWAGMKPSKAIERGEYCEFINLPAFFRQKMNSYSNLGFFFFGVIVFLLGWFDLKTKNNQNLLTQFPALSFLLGGCLVYLCFGSTLFHASLTWVGQRLDMNATYGVSIILVLIALYRLLVQLKFKNNRCLKIIFVVAFFVFLWIFIYLHLAISSTYLLPGMIMVVIALTALNVSYSKTYKLLYALISVIFLVAAFTLRQLDVAKVGCDPYNLWQGHSAWHILIGACPFFLYLFYRSETPKNV